MKLKSFKALYFQFLFFCLLFTLSLSLEFQKSFIKPNFNMPNKRTSNLKHNALLLTKINKKEEPKKEVFLNDFTENNSASNNKEYSIIDYIKANKTQMMIIIPIVLFMLLGTICTILLLVYLIMKMPKFFNEKEIEKSHLIQYLSYKNLLKKKQYQKEYDADTYSDASTKYSEYSFNRKKKDRPIF